MSLLSFYQLITLPLTTLRRGRTSKWCLLFSRDQIYKFTQLFLVYCRQGHFPLSLPPLYLTSRKTSFVLLVFYFLLSFFVYLTTRSVHEKTWTLGLCSCLLLLLFLWPWWSPRLKCICTWCYTSGLASDLMTTHLLKATRPFTWLHLADAPLDFFLSKCLATLIWL